MSRAFSSSSRAIVRSQPNLRDSGHSAPSPEVRMRQKTRAPGAARSIFSNSGSLSKANRRTPSSKARRMSLSFLMVLPKEMRSGVAPAASAIWISGTEAQSKAEPRRASRLRISAAGFAFTA